MSQLYLTGHVLANCTLHTLLVYNALFMRSVHGRGPRQLERVHVTVATHHSKLRKPASTLLPGLLPTRRVTFPCGHPRFPTQTTHPQPSLPRTCRAARPTVSALHALSDPYSIRLDVDFCDLDAMVHVNNTVYFRWFETLRVRQFSQDIYPEFSFTPVGKKPVISETWCRFRRPVELYDSVVIGCRVLDVDQPRGEFKQEYAVWSERQSTVAAVGGCTIVVCDFDLDGGPRTPIPDDWLPKLMALH
jgi:acyl-CoA thioester hydrolase